MVIKEEKLIIKGSIDIWATISYLDAEVKKPLIVLLMGIGTTGHYGNIKKLNLGIKTFATQNVNHILRQIDDNNDIMRVKQKYRRLSKEDIDKRTKDTIIFWIK